eukprot:Gb_10129 [translate_table: standard]
MLLRSSSTPILGSIKPIFSHSECPKELEPELGLSRCKSGHLSSRSTVFSSGNWDFEAEFHKSPPQKLRRAHKKFVVMDRMESEKPSISGRKSDIFRSVEAENSASSVKNGAGGVGLVHTSPGRVSEEVYENEDGPMYIAGGFGIGAGGGLSGGGNNGGGGSSGADSNSTDTYYQKMIEANPGNPLLLRNYARFLHEVQHDLGKAEEYYERAILASPGDGEILSLYAKLVWEDRKDVPRAQTYFDEAVKAAPDDCYVLASYAHFLWNSEDDEEEEDASELQQNVSTPLFHKPATAAVA